MEDNKTKVVSKRTFLKRFLMGLGLTILLSVVYLILTGKISNFKAIFIAAAIILPLMIGSAIITYKYQSFFIETYKKKIVPVIFIILGILSVIINGALVFIGKGEIIYYINLGVGFLFIFYGIYQLKKKAGYY